MNPSQRTAFVACLFAHCVSAQPLATGLAGANGTTGVAGAPGATGPIGPTGAAGQNGSPDTAEHIVEKLTAIDTAAAGLDAGKLAGQPASAYVRIGARSISIPVFTPHTSWTSNYDNGLVFDQTGAATGVFSFTFGPDFLPGSSAEIVALAVVSNSLDKPCTSRLEGNRYYQARSGQPLSPGSFDVLTPLENSAELAAHTSARVVTMRFSLLPQPPLTTIQPGDAFVFKLSRNNLAVTDTCTADILTLVGLRVSYTGG